MPSTKRATRRATCQQCAWVALVEGAHAGSSWMSVGILRGFNSRRLHFPPLRALLRSERLGRTGTIGIVVAATRPRPCRLPARARAGAAQARRAPVDSRRARGAARRLWLRPRTRRRRLVRRERPGRPVVDGGERRKEAVRLGVRLREPGVLVPAARHQTPRPGAGRAERPLPLRVGAGGVPRAVRGVQAARRGCGAAPPAVGLLPQSRRDRAHLRGCRRRAMRDPDGRCAVGGPAAALPGVGARGALRRERGGGDVRPEAGVRAVPAVTAGAALVLGPPPLGLAASTCSTGYTRRANLRGFDS